jgi:hypothetical protein
MAAAIENPPSVPACLPSSPIFKTEDWIDFRQLGTLTRRAGVTRDEIPSVIAKELVDNALDAVGDCIFGLLDGGGLFVEDRGAGIEPSTLADLFSIKRPRMSSKLWRLPTRGALGNGLRVVVGAVLATGGSLHVETRGHRYSLRPTDNGSTIVETVGTVERYGTRIEVRLGAEMRFAEDDLEWARLALSAQIGGEFYAGKPSAYWYDSGAFFELCQAAGDLSARAVVERLDGCTGAKAGTLAAPELGRTAGSLSRADADGLLHAARAASSEVRPQRLGKLGRRAFDGYAIESGFFTERPGVGGFGARAA